MEYPTSLTPPDVRGALLGRYGADMTADEMVGVLTYWICHDGATAVRFAELFAAEVATARQADR